MLRMLKSTLGLFLVLSLITGVAYPLVVTGIARDLWYCWTAPSTGGCRRCGGKQRRPSWPVIPAKAGISLPFRRLALNK